MVILGVNGGVIQTSHEINHGKATSFQTFNLHHYHDIPTYIKSEDKHLLEHPVEIGETASKVEVDHGNKHEFSYGVQNTHSTLEKNNYHVISGGHSSATNQEYNNVNNDNEHLLQAYQSNDLETHGQYVISADVPDGTSSSNQHLLQDDVNHAITNYPDGSSQSHYQVSEGESHA